MSLNAAAIAVMVERGLSAADILAVAEALEVRRDPTAAERQARYRAKVKEERNGVTRDVTRDTPPNEEDILTPPLPPVISNEITTPIAETQIKPEHVVEVWNDTALRCGLSLVKKLTPERRKKLQTFIRRHSIDDITEAIAAIPRSPFLMGENNRGWRASFDWFLEPRNVTKLTEETYVH